MSIACPSLLSPQGGRPGNVCRVGGRGTLRVAPVSGERSSGPRHGLRTRFWVRLHIRERSLAAHDSLLGGCGKRPHGSRFPVVGWRTLRAVHTALRAVLAALRSILDYPRPRSEVPHSYLPQRRGRSRDSFEVAPSFRCNEPSLTAMSVGVCTASPPTRQEAAFFRRRSRQTRAPLSLRSSSWSKGLWPIP